MKYERTERGIFLDRPNRFIARVEVNGHLETVHVKNTGRCRELLLPGTPVVLEDRESPSRKTRYDLICVNKGGRLINVDSQAPNAAVKEWLLSGGLLEGEREVFPETTFGNSRFDFYVQSPDHRIYMEVKGVTLEEEGVVRFPDAPTRRGVKHLEELMRCVREGYEACLLFVVQMKGVRYLEPNWKTHPLFAQTLIRARDSGVALLAYDCLVTEDSLVLDQPVEIQP